MNCLILISNPCNKKIIDSVKTSCLTKGILFIELPYSNDNRINIINDDIRTKILNTILFSNFLIVYENICESQFIDYGFLKHRELISKENHVLQNLYIDFLDCKESDSENDICNKVDKILDKMFPDLKIE